MSLFNKIAKLANKNVYYTNILLIPSILFCIISIMDIHNWTNIKTHNYYIYLSMWYLLLFHLIITTFFSTIHHKYMYTDNFFLSKIGTIDHIITAPLMGVIIFLLSISYFIFLIYKPTSVKDYKDLYFVALLYIIFGLIIFILKKIFYKGWSKKNIIKKLKYLYSHTFFHYISYTGISLITLIHYLNNNEIYNFFNST
jgi:hypothetical protein